MSTYNVRTGAGTIHRMTAGRTFRFRGWTRTNNPEYVNGKADCGALTSSAATFTDQPITCAKCAGTTGKDA